MRVGKIFRRTQSRDRTPSFRRQRAQQDAPHEDPGHIHAPGRCSYRTHRRVILEVSLSNESRSGNFSSPIPCGLFERRSVRLRASQDNAIRSVHNALLQKRRGALSKRVYIDQIILAAGLKFTREEAAEGFIKDVISLGSAGIGEMKWSR